MVQCSRALLTLPLLALPSLAVAESADVLPKGAYVGYAGIGSETFAHIRYQADSPSADGERDRVWWGRLQLYGAMAPVDRLQVSLALPLVMSTVSDHDDRIPCSSDDDPFCEPIQNLGEAALEARVALLRKDVPLTLGLGAVADPWNAGEERGQFNAIGQGAFGAVASIYGGPRFQAFGNSASVVAWARYRYTMGGRTVDGPAGELKAPGDFAGGGAEVQTRPAKGWMLTLGGQGGARPGGVGWDTDYMSHYIRTDDRWGVLRYKHIDASAKVSRDLKPDGSVGLHVGLGRTVWAVNAPPDLWWGSVGVHKYVAPGG